MPLHVSSTCAHHQEVKIALHSLWYHHNYRCGDTRGCVMQFWPPDDEHMCSKHVEAWNKLIVKQKFCASSWLITEINGTVFSWILVCRSDDGPENGLKLFTLLINCVVHDWIFLDTFIMEVLNEYCLHNTCFRNRSLQCCRHGQPSAWCQLYTHHMSLERIYVKDLYPCTVHFVVYLSNTPTNAHI